MLVCETEVSVRLPVAARKVTAGVIDAVPMAPEKVSVAPLAISKVPAVPDASIAPATDRTPPTASMTPAPVMPPPAEIVPAPVM